VCTSKGFIHLLSGGWSRFGLSVRYLLQERPLGIAHAVSLAERHVSGLFLVYLGDNLLQGDVAQYLRRFADFRADALVLLKEVDDPTRFGVAVFNGDAEPSWVIHLLQQN